MYFYIFTSLIMFTFYKLYTRYSKSNALSLIPEDGIRIIEIYDNNNHSLNTKDIQNYLEHHILTNKDIKNNFNNITFDNPIHIKFIHSNNIYKICLNGMTCTKEQHKNIISTPKFLSAVLKNDNNEIYVTDELSEYHGPNKNYFSHIPDAISSLKYLLGNKKGELHTYDMMGNSNIIKL